MAFAPIKRWKLPYITRWESFQNRNPPIISADEVKIEALEKEKSDLIQEAGRLREELARKSASPDTVKHRGVVFKGVSKGAKGVEIDCAACGVALSSAPPRSRSEEHTSELQSLRH